MVSEVAHTEGTTNRQSAPMRSMATQAHAAELPDDILISIFLHTISKGSISFVGTEETLGTSKFRSYTPWLIRRVCSRWRLIVMSTNALWNEMAIEGRHTTIAELLLPKEGPLTLALGSSYPKPTILSNPFSSQVLQGFLPRVVSLVLQRLTEGDFERVLYLNPTCFPSLQQLSLIIDAYSDTSNKADIIQRISQSSANFRRLNIVGLVVWDRLFQIQVPWEMLTHVTLNQGGWRPKVPPVNFSVFLDVIKRCTNILEASFSFTFDFGTGEHEPVRMPHLRRLHICLEDPRVVQSFILPSLSHLHIESFVTDKRMSLDNVAESLITFIGQSFCKIRRFREELTIRTDESKQMERNWKTSELKCLFSLMPDVQEIYLTGMPLGQVPMEEIGRGILFPNLTDLDCGALVSSESAISTLSPRFGKSKNMTVSFARLFRVRIRSYTWRMHDFDPRLLAEQYLETYGIDIYCYN